MDANTQTTGNLLYIIKPHDVEQMLIDNGFADIEKIHISVDPVSARNPGYCFVDFTNRPSAEQALTSLNASIQGRYVKVGPCEPKKQGKRAYGEDRNAFQRWGDWSVGPGNTTETTGDKPNLRGGQQGPHNAISHFEDMKQDHDGRRLFVGGLSKMINQAHNSAEMMEIFADFSPYVHHCFLFTSDNQIRFSSVVLVSLTDWQYCYRKAHHAPREHSLKARKSPLLLRGL